MSDSRRRTPIFGWAGGRRGRSEKDDKLRAHRHERRDVGAELRRTGDAPLPRLYVRLWDRAKDGKHWWGGAEAKDMRK